MPITYPSLPLAYPVMRTLEFSTGIAAGANGTEQRWMRHAGRESWALTHPRLTLTQRNLLAACFDAAEGSYGDTVTLTFLGTEYTGLHFEADQFTATESENGIWSVSVKLVKHVRSVDVGALGASFPALASGHVAQLPFTHGRAWDTVAVETEGGRYAFANRSAPAKSWSVGGNLLSNADADTIWSYFALARGRLKTFAYTDTDDSNSEHTCRFSEDSLERRYSGPDENAVTATIQEIV